mgnify:CR=1 FL=1
MGSGSIRTARQVDASDVTIPGDFGSDLSGTRIADVIDMLICRQKGGNREGGDASNLGETSTTGRPEIDEQMGLILDEQKVRCTPLDREGVAGTEKEDLELASIRQRMRADERCLAYRRSRITGPVDYSSPSVPAVATTGRSIVGVDTAVSVGVSTTGSPSSSTST